MSERGVWTHALERVADESMYPMHWLSFGPARATVRMQPGMHELPPWELLPQNKRKQNTLALAASLLQRHEPTHSCKQPPGYQTDLTLSTTVFFQSVQPLCQPLINRSLSDSSAKKRGCLAEV